MSSMGKTMTRKILDAHTERVVEDGKLLILNIDTMMVQDGSGALVIDLFNKLAPLVFNPDKIVFVLDHSAPSPLLGVSEIHNKIRQFAKHSKVHFFDVGAGICHQLMLEHGFLLPGSLLAGGESHTCMYGALNTLGLGLGASDMAAIMATGRMWSLTPSTVSIELRGAFLPGVSVRDLVFHLISVFKLEYSHLRNFVIEYSGDAIEDLSMAGRMAICNMANEMGAIGTLMPYDKQTDFWARKYINKPIAPVDPDPGADYDERLVVNLEEVSNMIALPHSPDNVDYITKLKNIKIDQAIIGTCACGQLEDFEVAARILRGKTSLARLIIVPPSRKILKELIRRGVIDVFLEAGGVILPPGCGPCVGTHMGIIASGEVVISTSNRNYQGLMGSMSSHIYLASPEVVAASAVAGIITKLLEE